MTTSEPEKTALQAELEQLIHAEIDRIDTELAEGIEKITAEMNWYGE